MEIKINLIVRNSDSGKSHATLHDHLHLSADTSKYLKPFDGTVAPGKSGDNLFLKANTLPCEGESVTYRFDCWLIVGTTLLVPFLWLQVMVPERLHIPLCTCSRVAKITLPHSHRRMRRFIPRTGITTFGSYQRLKSGSP